MELAYLTTQYPKPSHTFIRREIQELERRGHRVLRLAIRRPVEPLVEAEDQRESERTVQCLEEPRIRLIGALLRTALQRPGRFAAALRMALGMGLRSRVGLLRHCAYLTEACFFLGLLEQSPVEHLHVHFGTNSAAVARLLRALGGPPYSVTVHGPAEFDDPIGFDLAGKLADASFGVAISNYTLGQLRRWTDPRDWERLHVVRCGVDQSFLQDVHPIREGCDAFVCVGRLTPQKGQLQLVAALASLATQGLHPRLVLVGDGELRPQIERAVRAAGLEEQVTITGWLDEQEVREQILRSRCLVLPSFAEGLPVVIMESLALGRPVISCYVAGIPELVEPGRNGWLVPAGNDAALTEALREACIASEEDLDAMGQEGRKSVQARHAVQAEVTRLEMLMREAIARTAAPTAAHAATPSNPGSHA